MVIFFKKVTLFSGKGVLLKGNKKGQVMEIDIEAYYVRYAPMVYRRCAQILKDEGLAEDAMQDVFVQLMKNKERLKGEYPSSLLYRMATNICLNIIRSRSRKREEYQGELLDFIAAYQEDHEKKFEVAEMIRKVFSREKESTRVIAVLHWIDGLTLEETAAETGMSVSGVRKRLREMKERAKELNLEVN